MKEIEGEKMKLIIGLLLVAVLFGCATSSSNKNTAEMEDSEWNNAKNANTYESYHRFFMLYPNTKYSSELRKNVRSTMAKMVSAFDNSKGIENTIVPGLDKVGCLRLNGVGKTYLDFEQREAIKRVTKTPWPTAVIGNSGSIHFVHDFTDPMKFECKPVNNEYDFIYNSGSGAVVLRVGKDKGQVFKFNLSTE